MGIGAANYFTYFAGALFSFPLNGSAGGKMLSYIARASRIRRARSRSDFETNRTISPMFGSKQPLDNKSSFE
jgi:hypothetical protein